MREKQKKKEEEAAAKAAKKWSINSHEPHEYYNKTVYLQCLSIHRLFDSSEFLFQSATCKFCTQNEQTVKRHHESWKSLTKTVHQKPNHHVFHFSSTSRIHLNRSITCNYIVYRSSLYYAKTNDCGLGTRSCHYTVDSDLLYLNGSQRTQYALRRRLISFLSISMWEAQPFLYLSISGSPSPISCQKHTQFVTGCCWSCERFFIYHSANRFLVCALVRRSKTCSNERNVSEMWAICSHIRNGSGY